MRARHRLSKFLLRKGRIYTQGKAWTLTHGQWLTSLEWEHECDRDVFEDYRLAISHLEDRIRALDGRIEGISQEEPYRDPVGWLRCFRGIDTVTAMTLLTEIHNFWRFRSARELMSYLGLVPSESSSGDWIHRGAITKGGEWSCPSRPCGSELEPASQAGGESPVAQAPTRAAGLGHRSRGSGDAEVVAPVPALTPARQASQQGDHRLGSGVCGIHLGGSGGGESSPRQESSLVWDQEDPAGSSGSVEPRRWWSGSE